MDDTDKIKVLVEDATGHCGLNLLPPDVNQSSYRFTAVAEPNKKANRIRYGLGAVKGTGRSAIEAIVQARESGPFSDLFDFVKRIDKRHLNRRAIESLIKAGAMDCFGINRGVLMASVGRAIDSAEQAELAANQVSLFESLDAGVEDRPEYVDVVPPQTSSVSPKKNPRLVFIFQGIYLMRMPPK